MRAHQFLIVEYDRSKTEANFGAKIVAVARRDNTIPRDFRDPEQVTDEQLADVVINTLEDTDPTKNKEYVQALANLYSKGGIKFEDMGSTVADYITKFHKLKQRKMIPSPRNDFMRYTNIADFMGVVDEYPDPDQKEEANRGQARSFYEDDQIRVIIPDDREAACYYGQGTRWCTAANNNNMFGNYSSQGPLYIVIPKQPKTPGEKYQFHFETAQYMDVQDHPVNLRQVVARYPSIQTAFAKLAVEHTEPDLMPLEQARKFVEEAKKDLEAKAKHHPGGIISVNTEDYNSELGFNNKLCRQIYSVTGHNLGENVGVDLTYAGDHTWCLIDTKTGDVQVVSTDMEGSYVYVGSTYDYEQNQNENLSPAMTRAVQDLSSKLDRYMKLNNAQGDWDDEAEDENQALEYNPEADQELLDQIFAEYGTPANRKTDY